ncbi:MAG: hypothetical protein ACOVP1_06945 [Bacteroidia bacterium]
MRKAFIFICILGLLTSCQKPAKCDESDIYSYLSPSQKNSVPYQGDELIKLKSEEGDTLKFKCTGKTQSFNKTQKVGEDINCARAWYLENLNYTFICEEDSTQSFQVTNRVNTEYSFSSLDFFIRDAPSIKSEDYHLTNINFFKDSIEINGRTYKALNIYFNNGTIAGKWVQEYGLAQLFLAGKYFTIYD